MDQVRDIVDDLTRVGMGIHTLTVHMALVKDIPESQVREKYIHTLTVHMDQVRDIVDDLTRVGMGIHTLTVHMALVKDIPESQVREKYSYPDRPYGPSKGYSGKSSK